MIQNRAAFNIKPPKRVVPERTLPRPYEGYVHIIAPRNSDSAVTEYDPRFQWHEAQIKLNGDAFADASVDKAVFLLLNSQPGRLGRGSLLDAKCNSARFEPLGILRVDPLIRFG